MFVKYLDMMHLADRRINQLSEAAAGPVVCISLILNVLVHRNVLLIL